MEKIHLSYLKEIVCISDRSVKGTFVNRLQKEGLRQPIPSTYFKEMEQKLAAAASFPNISRALKHPDIFAVLLNHKCV